MRKRAAWIAGSLVALAVASTTAEQRAEAKTRLARWNPLFLAITIACMAFMLWPWS